MSESSKLIRIRHADPGDTVAIYRLLDTAISEMDACPMPDANRLLMSVAATMTEGEVWVADLSGRVVGTVALVPHKPFWSDQWMLASRWLYVMRKFRSRGTGNSLMQAVTASADEKQASLMISAQGGCDEFVSKVEGMQYGGGLFMRGVKP